MYTHLNHIVRPNIEERDFHYVPDYICLYIQIKTFFLYISRNFEHNKSNNKRDIENYENYKHFLYLYIKDTSQSYCSLSRDLRDNFTLMFNTLFLSYYLITGVIEANRYFLEMTEGKRILH